MGILARLRLTKIRTMARPNSPDMPPKRTKKVRLGIIIENPAFIMVCSGFLDVQQKLAVQTAGFLFFGVTETIVG